MAGADYRDCDVCGGKAFYDANLNYEQGPRYDYPAFRIAGEDQCSWATDPVMKDKESYRLDYLGDWAVICNECAKTHKAVVLPLNSEVS